MEFNNPNISNIKNHSLTDNKEFYDEQHMRKIKESLQWHRDKVKELEKAIEWHHENENNIRESLGWHINRVKELERAIEWHHENENNMKKIMEEKESEFEIEINRYKTELLELRKKVFEMENSFSWRLTRCLRRGK